MENDGLKEIRECKYYQAPDYIFLFAGRFAGRFLGRVDTKEYTTEKSRYSDLMNLVTFHLHDLHGSELCERTIEFFTSTLKRTSY